jgi:hypothetical protein
MKDLARWLPALGVALIFCSPSVAQDVVEPEDTFQEFQETVDRVQQVYDNVTSFQQQIYSVINAGASSITTSGNDWQELNQGLENSQQFWDNAVPQEIADASKIAVKNLFPNVGEAINSADEIDKWASQPQNDAGQSSADLKDRIADYFGARGSAPSQGGACAIFEGGMCPPCAYASSGGGVVYAPSDGGNCPDPKAISGLVTSNAPTIPGLETDGNDQRYLGQSSAGWPFDDSRTGAMSSQLPSGITVEDLASIEGSPVVPQSTSSPIDVRHLRAELAAWDQRHAEKSEHETTLPAARAPTSPRSQPHNSVPNDAYEQLEHQCLRSTEHPYRLIKNYCNFDVEVKYFSPACRQGCMTHIASQGTFDIGGFDRDTDGYACPYPESPNVPAVHTSIYWCGNTAVHAQ